MLAGGASRRMGRDKALVTVGGRPLAAVAAAALVGAGADPVLAIGGDAAGLAALGLVPVSDRHPGEGPLGGVRTALAAAPTDLVVVLACDLPRARAEAVAAVVAALVAEPDAGAAVPEAGGRLHPLHGAWRRSVAGPVVDAAFAGGERSVAAVLAAAGVVAVAGIDPGAVRDADTPGELGTMGSVNEQPGVPEVDVEELARRVDEGAYVLDVREPDEYEAGHVPGAVLVPLGEVQERAAEVPADREVYVVCGSGGRSARAVGFFNSAGLRTTNVAGGTKGWIRAGHPVTPGPTP